MFDRGSQPTFTESVLESVNSAVESADSTANSPANHVKSGLWIRA